MAYEKGPTTLGTLPGQEMGDRLAGEVLRKDKWMTGRNFHPRGWLAQFVPGW